MANKKIKELYGRSRRRLERPRGHIDVSRRFLFITGVGRSGTTLAALLLGASDRIALGIERFGWWEEDRLHPGLYDKTRFYQFRPWDTVPGNYQQYAEHYEKSRDKLETATYVGDKLPNLTRFAEIARKFQGATFIFCHRNVYDLATSWHGRLTDPDDKLWGNHMDHREAVRWWNESLRAAGKAKECGVNIIPCDYATLTDQKHGERYYRELLNKLGLPFTEPDSTNFRHTVRVRHSDGSGATDARMAAEIAELIDQDAVHEFSRIFAVSPSLLWGTNHPRASASDSG